MTDPLTPPECDLRDFGFMPLDVLRLRDSELAAISDAEVFRAAVLSWCVAWHQVPAASLPDDDAALCRLLGYGRDMKGWLRLRAAGALRGYVLCADGRLYHHVVAEKARESWQKKLAQRERTAAAREARMRQKQEKSVTEPPSPLSQTPAPSVTCSVTDEKRLQGTGTVKGQGEEERTTSLRSVDAVPASLDARTELFRTGLAEVRRMTGLPDGRARSLLGKCLKAAEDNASAVSDAIARCADTRPAEAVPWLLQACQKPQFRNGFLAVIAEEGWAEAAPEPEPPNPFLLGGSHGPH